MTTPTRTELAIELLKKQDRCGHIAEASDLLGEGDWVCTRMRKHSGGHIFEPAHSIIPFE